MLAGSTSPSPGRGDRRRRRAGRVRPRGGPAGAADAGLQRPDLAEALETAGGARCRRQQARRHPDPGAPRRRRGARCYAAQPRRHHRPAARGGRGGRAPLPARTLVLDGEAHRARPRTAGRGRSRRPRRAPRAGSTSRRAGAVPLTPYFFDVLHLDGARPARRPRGRAARAAGRPGARPPSGAAHGHRRPRRGGERVRRPARRAPATRAWWSSRSTAPYDAGRRGAAWVKVKPRHTLDLVVLAVEWGSGRRRGWLSNIHLGARDPRRPAAS